MCGHETESIHGESRTQQKREGIQQSFVSQNKYSSRIRELEMAGCV